MSRVHQPLSGVPVAVLGRAAEAVPGSGLRFNPDSEIPGRSAESQTDNMPSPTGDTVLQELRETIARSQALTAEIAKREIMERLSRATHAALRGGSVQDAEGVAGIDGQPIP